MDVGGGGGEIICDVCNNVSYQLATLIEPIKHDCISISHFPLKKRDACLFVCTVKHSIFSPTFHLVEF